MTRDELIRTAEIRDKSFKELPVKSADEYLNGIALATLKADKAGYRMYTYCYSERDLVPAECELSILLEGLEK